MSILGFLRDLASKDVSVVMKGLNKKNSEASKEDKPTSKASKLSNSRKKHGSVSKKSNSNNKRYPIINSKSEIPSYVACLSNADGFKFTNEYREKYIVLQKDTDSNKVYIICASSTIKGGLDQDYMSIYERCISRNLKPEKLYAKDSIIGILYEIDDNKAISNTQADEFKDAKGLQREFDAILIDAARNGISDLHFEVRRNSAVLRERKDGQLNEREPLPVQKARKMAAVIYQVIAEEQDTTFNESIPQDGVIDREIDGVRIRVRLATLPAYPDGFDMIMRILTMGVESKTLTFEDLGYAPEQIRLINDAISQPKGVTVLCGTTGSGKTTSLSTMLDGRVKHYEGRIKVISIEDPPEKIVAGVTQVPVGSSKKTPDGKNPFSAAIRASMRADPDIINIGEVRDEDSAELLVHATQSGHQAFTTTHAPSAISTVARFRGFGVTNDVLGSPDFFSCLIYQTLVPLNCSVCSIKMTDMVNNKDKERYVGVINRLRKTFDDDKQKLSNIRFRNTAGCPECDAGIKGRRVVAEVIVPDEEMFELISQGQDNAALRHYYKHLNGRSVMQYGIDLVENGSVCALEVERQVGLISKEPRTYYKEENADDFLKEISELTNESDTNKEDAKYSVDNLLVSSLTNIESSEDNVVHMGWMSGSESED